MTSGDVGPRRFADLVPVRREQPGVRRLTELLSRLGPPHAAFTLLIPPTGAAEIASLRGYESRLVASIRALADDKTGLPFGLVLFWSSELAFAVRPPFPPTRWERRDGWDTVPLLDQLGRPYTLGILLLRRGGFSVGVFEGDVLVDSKTGTRFVKNRHRKGGQSQRRFDRIREKQIDELFAKTCESAWDKLGPRRSDLDAIFLGGDRRTVQAFCPGCKWIDSIGDRIQKRFLPTPEPRQETLKLAYAMIWRSDWTELRAAPEPGADARERSQ